VCFRHTVLLELLLKICGILAKNHFVALRRSFRCSSAAITTKRFMVAVDLETIKLHTRWQVSSDTWHLLVCVRQRARGWTDLRYNNTFLQICREQWASWATGSVARLVCFLIWGRSARHGCSLNPGAQSFTLASFSRALMNHLIKKDYCSEISVVKTPLVRKEKRSGNGWKHKSFSSTAAHTQKLWDFNDRQNCRAAITVPLRDSLTLWYVLINSHVLVWSPNLD